MLLATPKSQKKTIEKAFPASFPILNSNTLEYQLFWLYLRYAKVKRSRKIQNLEVKCFDQICKIFVFVKFNTSSEAKKKNRINRLYARSEND